MGRARLLPQFESLLRQTRDLDRSNTKGRPKLVSFAAVVQELIRHGMSI